ncbi:hypothetical protein B4147_2692 [Bacillus wiedmannii]|uniref:Uncharacterized protein n=1 Tax=Bacillus wiedmannii TaxID=1890302 RepID=A0A0G8C2U7_9BACI|nr:hypothetical protein B4147_2692 [Bacillus wiedmannii]
MTTVLWLDNTRWATFIYKLITRFIFTHKNDKPLVAKVKYIQVKRIYFLKWKEKE